MRRMAFALTLVLAGGMVVGCGGREEAPETTETAPPAEPTPPPPPPLKTAMAMLQPLGSNQVSGQATFTESAAGGVDRRDAKVGWVIDGRDDRSAATAGRLMERGVEVKLALDLRDGGEFAEDDASHGL